MSLLPDNTYGWGPIETAKNYGRIGISANVSCTDTDTVATVTLEVWFWSKYSATDSNNKLYFDLNTTTASTHVGKVDIKTTHDSGSGWNAANKVRIYKYSFPVDRGTSNKTLYCAAKLTGVDIASGTMTHSISYVIPAIKSYTITYSPNGCNATVPGPEKKYYNQPYTVSSTVPSPPLEGHTCTGWVTDAAHGTKFYPFGSPYTANAPITFYANWTKNRYRITLNLNGGTIDTVTGVKVDEKEYGASYVLPSPTRTDYKFLGWSTSATANSAAYAPGSNYVGNTAVTLYAVWELEYIPPIISNVVVERCDAEGNHADDGTYFDVSFTWATDESRNAMGRAVYIKAYDKDGMLVVEQTFNISDFASFIGNFSLSDFNLKALGGGYIDNEHNYTVSIAVTDNSDRASSVSSVQRTLRSVAYPIDILAEGKGIAFGKPASKPGVMDINFEVEFNKPVTANKSGLFGLGNAVILEYGTDLNTILTPGIYALVDEQSSDSMRNAPEVYVTGSCLPGRLEVWWANGTDDLELLRSNGEHLRIIQRYTSSCARFVYTRNIMCDLADYPDEVFWHFDQWVNDALRAYPIGSFYISDNNTSPEYIFGGTWVRISDRFLFGASQWGVYPVGTEGGEEKHTLTEEELPPHQHTLLNENSGGTTAAWSSKSVKYSDSGGWTGNVNTSLTGEGKPHNNMPPFVSVAIWRRTA